MIVTLFGDLPLTHSTLCLHKVTKLIQKLPMGILPYREYYHMIIQLEMWKMLSDLVLDSTHAQICIHLTPTGTLPLYKSLHYFLELCQEY